MKRKDVIQKDIQHFISDELSIRRAIAVKTSKFMFNHQTHFIYNYKKLLKTKNHLLSLKDIKLNTFAEKIKTSLVHKLPAHIQIKVVNTKVILSGIVNSFYQKSNIEKIAANVHGVQTIENQLVIEYDNSLIDYVY